MATCRRMDSGKCSHRRRRSRLSTRFLLSCRRRARRCGAARSRPRRAAQRRFRDARGVPRRRADRSRPISRKSSGRPDQHLLETRDRHARRSSGRIVFAGPTPSRPSSSVVADGEQLWMYDVELAQVTVAPFDDTVGCEPGDVAERRSQRARGFRRGANVTARWARVGQARAEAGRLGFRARC